MNSELLHGFYLGELLIEPLKGQITSQAGSGHLPPKAVEVLLCLASSPGELVTRRQLLETVWGKGRGSQEALGHAISEIRHALDDHADDPRYIQTLPKRGYRLLVDVTAAEAPSQAGNHVVPDTTDDEGGVWHTLLRHGVVQAAAAYLVAGWLLIQVADATFYDIGLPDWSKQFVTFVVIGGFPLLLLLAWFLEFAEGRIEEDRGQHSGGLFKGLERNYLAILIAYGLAASGAAVYQATVGFEVVQSSGVLVNVENAEPEPIPVVDNSLAVLKLLNLDGDEKAQAFSDGLSEDILDGLARIPGLSVSARGDAWSMPPNASSDVVRRRLRVANYIEGSVRIFGDTLRVVVQLIDTETGFHVFSRSFELDIADVYDMQKELTSLVVANLKLAVDPSTIYIEDYYASAPTRDAYYLFQLGREALRRPPSVANIAEGTAYFDQALELDDKYPAAHAGRCLAFTHLYSLQSDTDHIALAENACAQAMAVAPRLPIVINAVARLYFLTGRHQEAENMFRRALEIDEQDASALQGIALIRRRDQEFDEAERLMRRVIELRPGDWRSINTLGNMYFGMGRYREAIAEYRKVVYLDPSNFVTLGNLASANMMTGNFAAARKVLQQSIAIEDNATFRGNLGVANYYLGNFSEAVDAQRRAVELAPNSGSSWIGIADALYFDGELDEASHAYEKTIELSRQRLGVNQKDTEAMMYLAWSLAMTGDPDEAAVYAARGVEIDPADPYSHYFDAIVKLKGGDTAAAIASLEVAVESGYPLAMLEAEPILKGIRQNPRFVDLLKKNQ
ncbi:MAG TPA: tetratricopeptide repeat protein [Woeseiaceae bacterium]|nr:tetratricopeptide repeat protein [Woeseiaceae bacterium]